jgi:hypothetical protein
VYWTFLILSLGRQGRRRVADLERANTKMTHYDLDRAMVAIGSARRRSSMRLLSIDTARLAPEISMLQVRAVSVLFIMIGQSLPARNLV